MGEADQRARQIRVLSLLAARLERGEELVPTDVFLEVEEDLELRIDEAAIAEAWAMEPEPPASSPTPVPRSGPMARAPLEVRIFQRAENDLLALEGAPREVVKRRLDELEGDALPRGVTTIQTKTRGAHLRLRAGDHRILYRVRSGALVVVAITTT